MLLWADAGRVPRGPPPVDRPYPADPATTDLRSGRDEDGPVDSRTQLLAAADRLEHLAARTTRGDWRLGGLLATRPEVVAHAADGGTEHVAEARARTAEWITAVSPALAAPLAAWLRAAAAGDPVDDAAGPVARLLLQRLPRPGAS